MDQHLHDNLTEEVYQSLDIVEDPPHVPITESVEGWDCSYDFFSEYDNMYMP